jgi:hypothetical protein
MIGLLRSVYDHTRFERATFVVGKVLKSYSLNEKMFGTPEDITFLLFSLFLVVICWWKVYCIVSRST